jgi:hypothetical protein
MKSQDRVAHEWLAARRVIAAALDEIMPGDMERAERNASAIIDRLANHDPPILLEMQDVLPRVKKC